MIAEDGRRLLDSNTQSDRTGIAISKGRYTVINDVMSGSVVLCRIVVIHLRQYLARVFVGNQVATIGGQL